MRHTREGEDEEMEDATPQLLGVVGEEGAAGVVAQAGVGAEDRQGGGVPERERPEFEARRPWTASWGRMHPHQSRCISMSAAQQIPRR